MEKSRKHFLDRISSFSILLTMVVFIIIGLGLMPLLDVASKPRPKQGETLYISFQWANAAPRVLEQEVTSKIEGLVSIVKGVEKVSSFSNLGYGSVQLTLKKGVNISAVRFEVSSLLKQIKSKLPKKVSYPQLSGGDVVRSNNEEREKRSIKLLSYRINSYLDAEQIKEYVQQHVTPVLKTSEEVTMVSVTGGTAKYLEILYDPILLSKYGLTANYIADGIRKFIGKKNIIGDIDQIDQSGEKTRITLSLSASEFSKEIGEMPLTRVNGKVIYLNDLAVYQYKDYEPLSFFRINGLNTIYMNVFVNANANRIALAKQLKYKVKELQPKLKQGVYFTLTHDASKELQTELNKLIKRTFLCLFILLIFVFLVNRSWKYLSIISIALIANLSISVIFYYLFDIRLHTFSLAGIAVSLGIIIDATIVMVDHYSYYRDRKSFLAIFAALLTTIGALIILFFMPEYIQRNLYDFSRIIIINLSVALLVALFFVPALVDRFHYTHRKTMINSGHSHFVIKWSRFYEKYVSFTQKKKWIYFILLVLIFGLPVGALPDRIGERKKTYSYNKESKWYETLYNNTLGADYFVRTIKPTLKKTLGGTMRLFANSMKKNTYAYEGEEEKELTIRGKIPLGGTAGALNEKVRILEQFIARYKEIKRFETSINSRNAIIKVEFKKEIQKTGFPLLFEHEVFGQLLSIGGADWSTSGVSNKGFSSSLNLIRRDNFILLSGYNYNTLAKYAEQVAKEVEKSPRSRYVVVQSGNPRWLNKEKEDEFYMDFDRHKMALYQLDINKEYLALQELFTSQSLGHYSSRMINTNLMLESTQKEKFDIWHLKNNHLQIDNGNYLLSSFGEIKRRKQQKSIVKENQEYTMNVAYNFIGNYSLREDFSKQIIDHFNETAPVGYHSSDVSYNYYKDTGTQYWLILLIVVIIFFICAILFESLWQPFVIIFLIPVSFIGTFLTFYFSGVNFGTGGFASLVLLSGLVVNAGIYIMNEYNNNQTKYGALKTSNLNLFIRAYNHKIIPVFLTILSTVLGLVPFFFDSDSNDFWFSFALGASGGLLFSILALVFVMPIFMPFKQKKKQTKELQQQELVEKERS